LTLPALGDIDDELAFAEARQPRPFQGRYVHKHILVAAICQGNNAFWTAVLLSALSTSVMCGPLCPGPTRISKVSRGCTTLILLLCEDTPMEEGVPGPLADLRVCRTDRGCR
jgi:hypothetical protein